MSKQTILTFLREWLQYSDVCMKAHKMGAERPHSQVFTPWDGLCGNLDKWAVKHCTIPMSEFNNRKSYFIALGKELKALFSADGLDTCWTFGKRSFQIRFDLESNCRCPNRRRWVKKTIRKLEEELADGNH